MQTFTHPCALLHKINIFLRNMSSTWNERGIAEKHNHGLISVVSRMVRERVEKKGSLQFQPDAFKLVNIPDPLKTLSSAASPPSCWASGAEEVSWRSKETPQAWQQVPWRSKLLLTPATQHLIRKDHHLFPTLV